MKKTICVDCKLTTECPKWRERAEKAESALAWKENEIVVLQSRLGKIEGEKDAEIVSLSGCLKAVCAEVTDKDHQLEKAHKRVEELQLDGQNLADQVNRMAKERDTLRKRVEELGERA